MTDDSPSYPALKLMFDNERFVHVAREAAAVWPAFDQKRFVAVASDNLDALGIMQRMRQMAVALKAVLPEDYPAALDILDGLAPRIGHNFVGISLPEFVALYGRDDFDRSMEALRRYTQFGSAEFAIRHFIVADLDRAMRTIRQWANDPNEHVRRLASEGTRPRLPWSFQIKPLKDDPSRAMSILEVLKVDPSVYVRKSVANHLNDISKDHPDWLVERLAKWDQSAPETRWIVKQALRTLVKKGDQRALALVGASSGAAVEVERFAVRPPTLRLGDRLVIEAVIISTGNKAQTIIADYAIHYVKASGRPAPKVFKLKVLDLAPGGRTELSISQSIRDFTTRKHHPGRHKVELMLNGAIAAEGSFDLVR